MRIIKKLLLATLTTLSIITVPASAGERMTKDNTVEIHEECFLHPVLVKQVEEYDSLHDLTYKKLVQKLQYLILNNVLYMDKSNHW